MSKNDPRCVICKHLDGKHLDVPHSGDLAYNHVYGGDGSSVRVLLCRSHEVELFQNGQKRFFLQYYQILNDVISSDEAAFMRLFEKTVRANLNEIY